MLGEPAVEKQRIFNDCRDHPTAGLAGFVLNLLRLIKGRFGEDAHKFRVIGCNREPHRFAAGIVEADFGRIVFQVEIFRTFKSILHQFGRIQAIKRYVLKVAGIGLVDEVGAHALLDNGERAHDNFGIAAARRTAAQQNFVIDEERVSNGR